jgi:hypothetical protein
MSCSHTCLGFPYLRGVREEPEQLLRAHDPRRDVMDCVHHRLGRLHPHHARGATERHPHVSRVMAHAIVFPLVEPSSVYVLQIIDD